MLNRLQPFRNGRSIPSPQERTFLSRAQLLVTQSGRGKLTLAAIIRSRATGDPPHINKRHRRLVCGADQSQPAEILKPGFGQISSLKGALESLAFSAKEHECAKP
jgi:hypothetical protein